MLKKIVLGALLTGMVGALVAGGIIRTNATLNQAEARGEGGYQNGRSGAEASEGQSQQLRQNLGGQQGSGGSGGQGGSGGYGGGGGNGDSGGQAKGSDQLGTGQAQVNQWITLSGTVLSVNEDEVVVEIDDASQIVIEGRAWSFAQQQGFTLNAGDAVTVTGFYEDGEFKVGQIDLTARQTTIALRDENGRPMWSGQGQGGG
jgi:hypothetical protein